MSAPLSMQSSPPLRPPSGRHTLFVEGMGQSGVAETPKWDIAVIADQSACEAGSATRLKPPCAIGPFGSQDRWTAMGAAIIRYLLIFTAGLGSCIVILILLFHRNGDRSHDYLISPDGTTIVEKINCGAESLQPFDDYRISIRGTFGNCQDDNNNTIRIRNADSVGFVWLDNVHLLVAAPSLDDIEERLGMINNIAITYS